MEAEVREVTVGQLICNKGRVRTTSWEGTEKVIMLLEEQFFCGDSLVKFRWISVGLLTNRFCRNYVTSGFNGNGPRNSRDV